MNIMVEEFFKKHNMHPSQLDFVEETDKLVNEMKKGLEGSNSSLMMIPSYIKMAESIDSDKPVIAIDAGGTNLRTAVVTFTNDDIKIEHFHKTFMPGTRGEVTLDEFYNRIVDLIEPLLDYSNTVSFCFSYPCQTLPNQDGKVMRMSKEVYIKDIEGQILGESINKKLTERGLENKKFIILNDTVAAILSGLSHGKMSNHSGNIGFILGTGLNACYAETIENITKIDRTTLPNDDKMVINIETGGYSKMPNSTADRILQKKTKEPERYHLEKKCSGAYLGELIYITTQLGVEEGFFTEKFSEGLRSLKTFELWDVSGFIENPTGENVIGKICDTKEQAEILYDIIELVYHRVAKITAITFAGIMKQGEIGTNKEKPVAVVAEGTTFYKSPIFSKYLAQYTKEVLNDQLGFYCDYLHVEDAALTGTSVAGLIPFF